MDFPHFTPVLHAMTSPIVLVLAVLAMWSICIGDVYSRFWVMRRLRLSGLVVLIMLTFYVIGLLLMAVWFQVTGTRV
ncbi:hypothetical protein [Aliiroseovarius crassostreae]|uniref:hypothetical protein n=1 Tax=Aliiroseovarius crassostreae TaxID=154981 RepID=UPI003C7B22A5